MGYIKKHQISGFQTHHLIPKDIYLIRISLKAVLISSKILKLAPHPIKSNKEIVKLAYLKAKSSFRYAPMS